jgi:hypothetical protein
MDLTNSTQFFERNIPLLARSSNFVRYAACAVAAKHLGQVQEPELKIGPSRGRKAIAKDLTSTSLDFLW